MKNVFILAGYVLEEWGSKYFDMQIPALGPPRLLSNGYRGPFVRYV